MVARHAYPLVRYYALLLALAVALLLLLLLGLAAHQLQAQRRAELEGLAQAARERRMALDAAIMPVRDHVQALRRMAEDHLGGLEPQVPSPWRGLLRLQPLPGGERPAKGVSLEHLAGTPLAGRLGNVLGTPPLLERAGEDAAEVDMALDLFEPMRLRHLATSYLQWSYYFSARGDLVTIFPFASYADLAAVTRPATVGELIAAWLAYDVFVEGTPSRNPDGTPYWTQAYEDAGGTGWMVSHAAPVRTPGRFAGMVGADLGLGFFADFLGGFSPPAGEVLIVNDRGQVLAGTGAGRVLTGQPAFLGERLAADLRALPPAELLRPDPGFRELGGSWVAAQRLENAPFTLVHLLSPAELDGLVLPRLLPYGVMAAVLLLALLAAQLALQRGFVRPALALVRQIEVEARGEDLPAPRVPVPWRPWLDAVRAASAERRAYEAKLAASEARYRAVVETQTEFVLRQRLDGTLTFVNDAYCRHLGMRREELLNESWNSRDVVVAEDRARFARHLAKLRPERPTRSIELRCRRPDGSVRWESWTATGIFDADGRRVEIQSVGRDVTERKQAELALEESRAFLRAIVDDQTELVSRSDADFRLVFCNAPHARLLFGRTPEEVVGTDLFEGAPAWFRETLRTELLALTPQRPVFRSAHEAVLPSGEVRWFEWVDRALFDARGRPVGYQSVGRDVTEQYRAEVALRESEARLAAFMEHAPVGMHLKDLDGRYVVLNPEMAKVFGRPVEAMLGKDPAEVLTPEEAGMIRGYDREILEKGEPTHHEEFLGERDAYAWAMVIRFPVRDGVGRIVQIGGFNVDITAHKHAQAELEASGRRFRAIAESHPTPMVIVRLDGHGALFANRAFLAAFRLEPERLRDLDRNLLYARPEEREAVLEALASEGVVEDREVEMRRADGMPFPAMLTARVIEYEGSRCAVASFLDLSALKAAEAEISRQREALHQSEKLTALGSLLAGIAHELNNPLSVVTGYAELLCDTAPDAATRERAERMHTAAERCARIVKTFLAMARQKPPQRGAVELPGVVEGALELVAYGLRTTGVAVRVEMPPELPQVWGDADQLHQIFVNLVVNAQQALTKVPAPRRLVVRARPQGEEVVVEVEDNGPGMPPEIRKRIFEPFFTTKPQGVGTGIGLSVCHGIVAAHGGRIEIETGDGRGTLFRVVLPVARGPGTKPADSVPASAVARGRVLVVDDEREIAELVAETLRRDGLEAEIAADGHAALARLGCGGIDLVVSDLRMPGLDGAALIEAVRARGNPGLAARLILITGDALGAGANEVVREADLPILEKPLDLAALRREVQRLLDG
jgi:PAS domain S-box-containing protein